MCYALTENFNGHKLSLGMNIKRQAVMTNRTDMILWQFSQHGSLKYTINMCGFPQLLIYWNPNNVFSEHRTYVMVKDNKSTATSGDENILWTISLRVGRLTSSSDFFEIKEVNTSSMRYLYAAECYDEKNQVLALLWNGNDPIRDWSGSDDDKRIWKITPIWKA